MLLAISTDGPDSAAQVRTVVKRQSLSMPVLLACNAHHRVLKSALRSIKNNAASEVKELNEKVGTLITRTEPNRLDEAELARFLDVARTRWKQHYALILVLFTTTLRLSTALALRGRTSISRRTRSW